VVQAKLIQTNPEQVTSEANIGTVILKSIVDGMKSLLKPFRHDFSYTLTEDNGILTSIRFEIKIINLK
jgi:hypothetical protein